MSDDLSHYRAEFPITRDRAFLSHAAVSPLPRRAADAVRSHLDLVQTRSFLEFAPDIFTLMHSVQDRLIALINARGRDEIVLMPNTATGINTVAVSLPLQPGDNVIVLEGDYPANIYPWFNLAYRGIFTKVVPQHQGGLDLERLEQRIDNHTRVIAISTVMFATGFRNDIAAVGKLCHERGITFVVDGIQSLGALPLDVQACHIDFLASGGQKWLLSAPGIGFLYCKRERLADLVPGAYVGSASVVDPFSYLDYNLTFPQSAERFNVGTPNFMGIAALHGSLELLQEVGIERISARILSLVDTLLNDLSARGYRTGCNTASEHRSGIVVVEVPDADAACKRLGEAGVVVTPRGCGVRVAPHFYNTTEEVLRVGELLDAQ